MNKTHRRRAAIKRKHTRRNRNKIGGMCLTQKCREQKYKNNRLKAEKLIEENTRKLEEIELLERRKSAKIKYDKSKSEYEAEHRKKYGLHSTSKA